MIHQTTGWVVIGHLFDRVGQLLWRQTAMRRFRCERRFVV
jgi:hypothetical protein